MLLRIIHGELRPDTWDAYEEAYVEAMNEHGDVEGLLGRMLCRDLDNPNAGYTLSMWEDEASMRAYESSAALKNEILPKLTPFFSGKYETRRCEVCHEYGEDDDEQD